MESINREKKENVKNKNIEYIKKNIGAYPLNILENIKNTENTENIKLNTLNTKINTLSAKIIFNEKEYPLHSLYDPKKEAKILVKEIEENNEISVVFLFGLGFGYQFNEIRNINKDIIIAVIEPSYQFFNLLIENFDFKNIFLDKNTAFFIGENEIKDIENFISLKSTKKVKMFTLRSYAIIFNELASFYQKKVLDIVDKKIININTLSRFEKLWAYNISLNVLTVPFFYGVNKFFDKLKNIPAVVVSAGPSLEKNIHLLKDAKSKTIIIAVDTVVKTLVSNGVTPHFIVTIDPQKKNSKYFRGVKTSDSILIAEPSVDSEAIEHHNGAICFIDSVFPLANFFMSVLGARGELTMGGSVSTAALDFAIRAGCSPIITVGLDLSFPNHQTHIKGSYHEEDFFTTVTKLNSYDSRIYKVLVSGNLSQEKNIYGEVVFTDSRFQMYKNWYENHIKENTIPKYINATEGGVVIKGMENQTLKEVIATLPDLKIDIYTFLGNKLNKAENEKTIAENILIRLKEIDKNILLLKPLSQKALSKSKELIVALKLKKPVEIFLTELYEIDKKIAFLNSQNDFISITMQKAIKTVTEGVTPDSEQEKEFLGAYNSLHLYEAIYESVEFNHYIIGRALNKLKSSFSI